MSNMPQVPPEKKDRNLDINYVLSNRTFIKPLPGDGHLVNKNILETLAVVAKNFAYDMRSLKHAKNGKANDHELGKINDVGMKLGGLAIAAYLMTRKQTPLKKAMELVGLASFFGAMSLWPKIAIQLPTRLIHGFNTRKEYQDSFGRQKPFFQDPQYIPWDLVDDKKIHKIGDRMDVSRDIPNRREFIQEKMKKIAVQNNTLWMLTAGFATPITSALICNACEEPLNKFLSERTSKKADRLLDDIAENHKKYIDSSVKDLSEILDSNVGKPVSKDLVDQIKAILTSNVDEVTSTAIREDIENLLNVTDKKYVVNDSLMQKVAAGMKEELKTLLPQAQLNEILPNAETLMQSVESFSGRELSDSDMKKVMNAICFQTKKALKENNIDPNTINTVIHRLLNGNKTLQTTLLSSLATNLNEVNISKLKGISEELSVFKAKNALLDEYIYLKAGAAPETVVANAWNEVTGDLPKIFSLSDSEITAARHDRKFAGRLLRNKLELITSNPDEYNRVFTSVVEKISQLEAKIKVLDNPKSVKGSYNDAVDTIFEETARKLNESGFSSTAHRLVGRDGHVQGSLKNIQLSYAQNRLLGVRSSLYRLLNTMDFFKRISTMENVPALHDGMLKEMKEEIVEFTKQLSIEGATSDYMTRFYASRNSNPSTIMGQIETENGKVMSEFITNAVRGGRAEMPYDKVFFEEVMKLLYENNLHPDSDKILNDFLMEKGFKQNRNEFLDSIGGHSYFAKPFHKVAGKSGAGSSYTKFLRVGMPPDQMFHGTIKELFNTRQWLKTFGGFGAGLLGVTVLAQFFFGKMKTPERIKND